MQATPATANRLRALLFKVADQRPDSMTAHEFVEQVVWTLEAILEHDDEQKQARPQATCQRTLEAHTTETEG